MTNIWACPRGIAATGRPAGARFRNAFLGTVAAGALSLACGSPALAGPDACVISSGGTIDTCSGNQSAGIAIVPPTPFTTLNVNNLTTAIAPAGGTPGIAFSSHGDIIVTSNTGALGITTTGAGADGIYAIGLGAVTVTSTGNIAASGDQANGIHANGLGAVTVTSSGNIATTGAGANGILAGGVNAATVTSTGNITATGDQANGILANAAGAVSVTSTGNISVTGATVLGIEALGGGAVTVTSIGNITAAAGVIGVGIAANTNGNDAVTVTSTGNIAVSGSTADGILADSTGTGAVTVISTGNIAAAGNASVGIEGNSVGALTVTSTGNITAGSSGIFTYSTGGDTTVTSIGNITAPVGIGAVVAGGGAATVTSTGNITADGFGLEAYSALGAVTVTSIGNIAVSGANGVVDFGIAVSGTAVTVTSTGNITAGGNDGVGVLAKSSGGPIAITIKSGTVSGGSGTGAAVVLTGGSNNTLTNMGTLMALSGLAIRGDTGNNTVNNSGTVIGNVILGSGTIAFNNQAGGFFNSGTTIDLGAGNAFNNAGTLSPGGAGVIQTTALTGNLAQSATGTLLTDVNIAGKTSDRVNVSGTASLAGAVHLQVVNPTTSAFQQTVLSAAGGTTNNGLSLLASPALQAQLVFPNATDVVVQGAGINFVVPGLGANQTALGNALNGALQSGGAGGGPIFNALLNGPTSLADYGLALNQLSGETATGTQQVTFDAMNLFMGTMLDPFSRGTTSTPGGGASGYASEADARAYASDGRKRTGAARDAYAMFTKAPTQSFEARWNVWAAGFGGSQSTDGNTATGSNNTTSSFAGGVAGADYIFSPNTIAGFALAGGGTSFNVANGGYGRSDLFQAGAFIRHNAGAAYIAGALAYGWQDITTNRTVTVAGLDRLRAEFNANTWSGRVEGGYRFVAPVFGGFGLTPYAAGQVTTFDLPSYSESVLAGAGAFALSYGAKSVTDPRGELGLRTDKSYAMRDGILTLRGRLAWAHDYDTDRSIGATFQSLPGVSFVVNGAAQASDSVLVTASMEKKWLNGWTAAATFDSEYSNVATSYAGKGVLRYTW